MREDKYVEITSQQSHEVTFKRIWPGYCSHFMALYGFLELFFPFSPEHVLKGAKGFTPKSYNGTNILKDSYDNDDNDESRSASTTQTKNTIYHHLQHAVHCSAKVKMILQFIVSFILLLVCHTNTYREIWVLRVHVRACAVRKDT